MAANPDHIPFVCLAHITLNKDLHIPAQSFFRWFEMYSINSSTAADKDESLENTPGISQLPHHYLPCLLIMKEKSVLLWLIIRYIVFESESQWE